METKKKGRLTLIATPIGNLGDISERAIKELAAADLVAAEDTRHSGQLLKSFNIKKPLFSYYQHNEKSREQQLLKSLEQGQNIALISDAGTPGISDPGAAALRAAVRAGFEVDAVPGACAAIQALVLSGLPTDKFAFEGFLPRGTAQKAYLEELKGERRTLIFYESPHRIKDSLSLMAAVFGAERPAALCRELTKKFQEIDRASLGELAERWAERKVLGELVLVVGGALPAAEPAVSEAEISAYIARLLAGGMKHKAAAKEAAQKYDIPAAYAYQLGLRLKE